MVEEEKEEHGEGGGGREKHLERRPSEGGHSKDRSSGFKQVENILASQNTCVAAHLSFAWLPFLILYL